MRPFCVYSGQAGHCPHLAMLRPSNGHAQLLNLKSKSSLLYPGFTCMGPGHQLIKSMKLVIPLHFIYELTHFLILAESACYQI